MIRRLKQTLGRQDAAGATAVRHVTVIADARAGDRGAQMEAGIAAAASHRAILQLVCVVPRPPYLSWAALGAPGADPKAWRVEGESVVRELAALVPHDVGLRCRLHDGSSRSAAARHPGDLTFVARRRLWTGASVPRPTTVP